MYIKRSRKSRVASGMGENERKKSQANVAHNPTLKFKF